MSCAWRGVLEGSADAKNVRRLPNALVVDLCNALGRTEGGALVHLARTGEPSAQEPAAPLSPPGSGRHIRADASGASVTGDRPRWADQRTPSSVGEREL